MRVLLEVLSWACVALAMAGGGLALYALAFGYARPRAARPGARRRAWRTVRGSLIPLAAGVLYLATGSLGEAGWLTLGVIVVVIAWNCALWLRGRRRRGSGAPRGLPS